jgi:nucleotide-binding universal stress UspA family protein
MSKKFLVAVDGSDHGWKALDLATNLARVSDAEVVILHVVPYEPMPEGFQQFAEIERIAAADQIFRYHRDRTIGDAITSEAEARAQKNGFARVTTQVAEGNPANEIVALAKSKRADMLFLGSRGVSDLKGMMMGSISHKVMHLAPCTCVAVR